jgi:predicted NBD/HSP70 family sugar kinase
VTAEAVFSAAAQGDVVAMEVLERLADRFARVCGILSTVLNPELVVFCGGVATGDGTADRRHHGTAAVAHVRPPRIACSTLGDAIVTNRCDPVGARPVQEHALDDTRAERLLR